MAILTITESCPVHIAHGDNIPLNCFDEATGAFLAILVETAPVEDIIRLTKTWLGQEGNASVSIEFTDISGSEISVTYSA
jgi:hypothetical protein